MNDTKHTKDKSYLNIVKKYVENPTRLFTGLEIKRYWKNSIFKLLGSKVNDSIKAGRWSTYAHYNLLVSCQNIFQKHRIERGSQVWVNPLLSPEIVDDLIAREAQITSFDIEKDSLQFKFEIFKKALENAKDNDALPDLIVLNSFVGMGENISKIIEICKFYNVPICLILLEGSVNFTILENISEIKWGSVILAQYPDLISSNVLEFLNIAKKANVEKVDQLKNYFSTSKFYYLSFFIENRAISIPEYHLQDGFNTSVSLLNIYYHFYNSKIFFNSNFYQKLLSFTLGFADGKMSFKKLFQRSEFKNDLEAVESLYNLVQNLQTSALPDFIFELKNEDLFNENAEIKLSEICNDFQSRTKKLHTFFSSQVAIRPIGTLEIPTFYFNRVYSRYFCYTTEFEYWRNLFINQNITAYYTYPIHVLFKDKEYLKDANFVSRFIMII